MIYEQRNILKSGFNVMHSAVHNVCDYPDYNDFTSLSCTGIFYCRVSSAAPRRIKAPQYIKSYSGGTGKICFLY